jgi:hypothetical protein
MTFSPVQEQDRSSDPEVAGTAAVPQQRKGGSPSRLSLAAVTVGALSLAVRASVLRDAYFITDDYMLSSRAMENGLSLDYLTRVHTGHFEPIGFAVIWLLAHFAPFSWGWASIFLLGCQIILLVLMWQLLTELFGRRWLVLAPFTLFAFSSLTIAAFTWLSAGIIWLPLMISMAGLLRFHVRFIRDGRRRDAVIALLWFMVGMASFEKILLVLPFLVVFTLALENSFRGRPLPSRAVLRRQLPIWAGYAGLSVVYVLLYLRGSRGADASAAVTAPSASDLGDFVILSLGRTFIPGLFGGPWSWSAHSYGLALVDSPRLFDWVTWGLFIALVIGSIVLRRGASWYWTALAVYIALSLSIIAVGRVPYMGTAFALETRYLADAVIPAIVAIGVAIMPLVGERDPLTADGERLVPTHARELRGALLLATGIVSVLSLSSIAGYSAYSSNNPTRPFVANMRADLARMPDDAQLMDTELPENVLTPLWEEYNRVSRFVAPLMSDEEREELYTRTSYTKPYILADDGRVVPAEVAAAATSAAPAGWCFNNAGGTVTIPLTDDLYEWTWLIRIGYLATSDFAATLAFGAESQGIDISRGLGEIFVPMIGSGDTVTLTDLPPSAQICVGDVQVGTPAPQQ